MTIGNLNSFNERKFAFRAQRENIGLSKFMNRFDCQCSVYTISSDAFLALTKPRF